MEGSSKAAAAGGRPVQRKSSLDSRQAAAAAAAGETAKLLVNNDGSISLKGAPSATAKSTNKGEVIRIGVRMPRSQQQALANNNIENNMMSGTGLSPDKVIHRKRVKARRRASTSFIPTKSSSTAEEDDEEEDDLLRNNHSARTHRSNEETSGRSTRTNRSSSLSEGSSEMLQHLKKVPGRSVSSGGYMPSKLYGHSTGDIPFGQEDDEDDYGYGRMSESESESSDFGHRRRVIRRSSMSKVESQKILNEQLQRVHKYDDAYSGMNASLEELKETFATKMKNLKPRPGARFQRRSSISSVGSTYTVGSTRSKATDISLEMDDLANAAAAVSAMNNNNNNPRGRRPSMAAGGGGDDREGSLQSLSFQRSSNTLPVANVEADKQKKVSAKTDQMVESLVWFSFHTPRTVLEDLISHEIDIWREENMAAAAADARSHHSSSLHKKKPSTGSSSKTATKGLLPDMEPEAGESGPDDSEGSLSSLSDDGGVPNTLMPAENNYDTNFSETMMRIQRKNISNPEMIHLPKAVERECALLFVDMSGFTKLSTMLDVESLSKVINSYFDMIVSEVLQFGGDILKFAGDAFFAEWKVNSMTPEDDDDDGPKVMNTPLSELNASLAHGLSMSGDDGWDSDDEIPPISKCVLKAAKCAISIVEKFSDYNVPTMNNPNANANTNANAPPSDSMLNVHCGIGMGHLMGLHVGDYKEDQEEEGVELRREFLILGEPIDQVAKAADVAIAGQVMVSPEAMQPLAYCCDMEHDAVAFTEPVCIANKHTSYIQFDNAAVEAALQNEGMMQPYESLRMHCRSLNQTALARLHLQMALYVHPVIRSDELALSAAIQAGKISQPTETVEGRHRAEAELRSVFTIFVNAVMSPKVTGIPEVDADLFQKLADVMHVTSRELDRYSGHLRQFIVDDKGVVLIATFGLRGSTFPNMVSNNGLPAVFAIHRALKNEIGVENRIGATFGKVYCGVVGGIHRHEFAVMGAPVNLAARLMGSKVNNGILVDEAVRAQADARFVFKNLPPVQAKGYDKPVPILQPDDTVLVTKKKKSTFPFTGRKEEKRVILSAASAILDDPLRAQSSMVFLMGESGMGKTALALAVMEDVKKLGTKAKKIVTARSTSTETEQRIPLSSYQKIFLSIVHDLCEQEEHDHDLDMSVTSFGSKSIGSRESRGRSLHSSFRSRHRGVRQHSLRTRDLFEASENSDGGPLKDLAAADDGNAGDPTESPKAGDASDAGLDTFSRSLKEISEDLADLSAPSSRDLSSRDQLPLSLNSMSMHGDGLPSSSKRRNRSDLMASKSTHRPTLRRHSSRAPRLGHSLHNSRNSLGGGVSRFGGRSDDASTESGDTKSLGNERFVPYFEKLCWVCEQLNYPYEYADIVGSQFLGLEGASTVTEVDGHVPTMDELVEFLALAFICLADFADMVVLFIDDFQWLDSMSWKIFRVLCKRGKKMLMLCAMRSHDKQALRRLSTAANRGGEIQNHIEISMVPLDFSEIQLLMAVVLGYHKNSIPESLCTDVFQRTGGLPVYVVQMLENMKRKKTVELGEDGILKWTAAGLKDKRAASTSQTGAVMEETFLSRFDGLDVRVRKVLQSCAVLGLSFALSDVIQVHPEMEEVDIESALDTAVDELILIEQIEDDEEGGDEVSIKSGSTGGKSEASFTQTIDRSRASDGFKAMADRFFQFSHAMWRKNVLTTMLKERKIELHRLIAESMEQNQVTILEDSDISRLLTLFDHWKSCGDFCKSAPLALTVGARLEEWDLCAQSLELYEDALEMSFDSVNVSQDTEREWVEVSAKPSVLDLILRLHVHVGLCHKKLGDDQESITTFEDAFKIMRTASRVPRASKGLMIPIVSSLCVLQMTQAALDTKTKQKQEKLLERFLAEAMISKSTVHIGRALCMQAIFYSRYGELKRACESIEKLREVYNVEAYSRAMRKEYGRDYVIEGLAESVQWYYLLEEHERAEEEADRVIEKYISLLDPLDVDALMNVILPIVQVFRLTNRADDADWLLKRYIINPSHEHASNSNFWVPLFNPLAYVIELIMMEESEVFDAEAIAEMETWALAQAQAEYPEELEKKAHTLIGEICWRLANYRDEGDEVREQLENTAKDLLKPVARYPHAEFFLRKTAQALMDAF